MSLGWRVRPGESLTRSLYVAGVPGNPVVKIGISDCPTRRIIRMRVATDGTIVPPVVDRSLIEVLYQQPGGRPLERALHRHFASRRVAGEWFDLGPLAVHMIKDLIREIHAAWAGEVPIPAPPRPIKIVKPSPVRPIKIVKLGPAKPRKPRRPQARKLPSTELCNYCVGRRLGVCSVEWIKTRPGLVELAAFTPDCPRKAWYHPPHNMRDRRPKPNWR